MSNANQHISGFQNFDTGSIRKRSKDQHCNNSINNNCVNRKKKNLSFRQWEERKIKQIGIEKETEFFMRMCLTEEEKHSGEYFEEQDLKRRKKERDDFRNHYKRRIQDLKESYKIAKRKRRSKIKLALEMIRSEQKTRMKEVNKPKLEKKPWLSAKERRKEIERQLHVHIRRITKMTL